MGTTTTTTTTTATTTTKKTTTKPPTTRRTTRRPTTTRRTTTKKPRSTTERPHTKPGKRPNKGERFNQCPNPRNKLAPDVQLEAGCAGQSIWTKNYNCKLYCNSGSSAVSEMRCRCR